MKKRSVSLAVLLSLALMCMTLASCDLFGVDSDDTGTTGTGSGQKHKLESDNDFDNPDYADEEDEAVVIAVQHNEEDFYGRWSVKSDKAEYLYGNVDLKIRDDHTWSGNITEEDFHGKWQAGSNGIIIKDTEGIIHWNLYFTSNGQLVFKDMDDPDTTPLVLIRTGN